MTKLTGAVIGAVCLVVGAAVCYYVEKQGCENRIQQVREELKTAPVPILRPVEMEQVTIQVDFTSKPRIPFFEVVRGADPEDPHGQEVRRVTFRTNRGRARITVPVKGKVIFPNSDPIELPSEQPFEVNEDGAILVITERNDTDLVVYYQVHCYDGTDWYWAEGDSPPRMQIPPI